MKKLLFIFLLFITTLAAQAQYNAGWDKAMNFGARGTKVEDMRYVNNELFFHVRLFGKYKFAGVNYDPGTIQDYLFGKIKADGTQVLLFKIKANEIGEATNRIGVDGSLYVMRFGNSLPLTVGSLTTPAYGCQIIKIDNAGVPVWIKKLNQFTDDEFGTTWSSSTVPAMQVKDDGNIYAIVNSALPKNSKYPCRVLKLDSNGDEVWNYEMTGSIYFRDMPRQFVDDNGNVTFFVQSTGNILFNNESLPFEEPQPAGITYKNWLVSLDNTGNKKWNTSTRIQGIFYGVHPVSGQIYLLYSYSKSPAVAPSIAPFLSFPNTSSPASGYYTWSGIVILNKEGDISKSKLETAFPSQMQISGNRIIVWTATSDGSVFKAGENFVAFDGPGYAAMEVDADFKPLKAFKMPTGELMALNGNKFAVSGLFINTVTVANTTLNPSDVDGGATKNDILIAQGDLDNIPLTPENTTWTGAESSDWQNAANWTNGIPTGNLRATFNAGTVVLPTNLPASAKVGQLSISSGTELKLSGTYGALTVGDRLFNQGKVTAVTSGFFNFFGLKQIGGTGEFSLNGPAQIFNFNGVIENTLSFDNSISLLSSNFSVNKLKFIGANAKFTGDIKVNSSAEDAVTVTGPTNFVNGTLTRAINATGNYSFPMAAGTGANEKSSVVTLSPTGLVGVNFVAAKYNNGVPTGTTPTVVAKGSSITSVLNGGFLTLTPDQQPTGGTYGLSFSLKGSTNTVANPLRYLIIKRDNSTSPWIFQGENNTAPISTGSGTTNMVTTSLDGITSFSDFAMGIGDLPITLPVRLMNFTAKANGNLALLNWQTASELNNDKFEIERSTNATDFIKIGEVKGNGTSQKICAYNFPDRTPANGVNYYRLKQVDFNGKFELSDSKAVNFNLETAAFSIYPNPTTDVVNFSSEVTAVEIYNLTGTKVFQLSGNTTSVKIPKGLSSGVYIIKATLTSGAKITKQLIVK